MNYEPIKCIGRNLDIPNSTVRLLIITRFGRMPKRSRIIKKKLKQAVHKALVLGMIARGVDVSEGLRRRYLK